jgi:hypothetical protein
MPTSTDIALAMNRIAGVLWGKHINDIVDDLDIVYTTHERSIYLGTIGRKSSFCAGKSSTSLSLALTPTVAQGLGSRNHR